jgi:zinc transport system substrate-binding protein
MVVITGRRITMLAVLSAALGMASAPAAAELKVVATIKPIHSLAAAVMEGVGTPAVLIDGSASPHVYALKPSDAARLNAADVVFRVSEALEPFTSKIFKSLPKSVAPISLADTPGLELLAMREGGNFEAHDHGGHKGHGHAHAGHKGQDSARKQAPTDGHIWLDPRNARRIAARIAEVLSARDAANAARYAANAEALSARLDALDREIADALRDLGSRPAIVFHDAYQYLEARYGVKVVGAITLNPETPPSARRLSELRAKVRKLEASCVFSEPQFEPKLVTTLLEGTSARSGVLDPLGARHAAGPGQYFAAMRDLAAGIRSCLAPSS